MIRDKDHTLCPRSSSPWFKWPVTSFSDSKCELPVELSFPENTVLLQSLGLPSMVLIVERAKLYYYTLPLQLLALSHLMQLSFWSPLWFFFSSAGKSRVNKKNSLWCSTTAWQSFIAFEIKRPSLRCLCSGIAPSILALKNELNFCLWANTCTLHVLCEPCGDSGPE